MLSSKQPTLRQIIRRGGVMSLRNRLVLPIILSSLAVLAGCGSSTNSPVPPPSGAFSNTDFSGTYTFSVEGSDGNGPMSIAGSFTACGCTGGTISAGTVDFFDAALAAPASAVGTNSTYSITSDGRGSAKLSITPTGGLAFDVVFDFVLTSSSHGLIVRYDTGGTGSGTIDLQPSAVAQSSLDATPYVFTLSGSDANDDILSTVGTFTLNSSGTITGGVEDCNLDGTPSYQSALSGTVPVGSGTAPGVGSILTACSSIALGFDVYAIDSTHLKLIESDGTAFLVGDAFAQTSTSIPQGTLVFTMQGLDGGTSGNPFAAGGTVSSDGASELSAGLEDVNDDVNGVGTVDGGVTPPVSEPFSGSFVASPSGSGRFLVSLTGFDGGATFAAYPSSGGILMLQVDSGLAAGITSGMALLQTSGAALAATQGYGLNNSGEDIVNGVELDEIAQFTTTSTGMTGLLNENDGDTLNTENVNGTYTPGSNGAGSATIGTGLQSIFYYAADSSTALFISTDPNQVASGVIEAQTAPSDAAQSAIAKPRPLPMLRALPRSRTTTRHNQGFLRPAK
jgi:hypothetical protein